MTAKAVAAELSIYQPGDRVVTGSELDGMSDEALAREIKRISVFARVTPAHKLRIVRALKKQGNVVAMTGDGVNDAPPSRRRTSAFRWASPAPTSPRRRRRSS